MSKSVKKVRSGGCILCHGGPWNKSDDNDPREIDLDTENVEAYIHEGDNVYFINPTTKTIKLKSELGCRPKMEKEISPYQKISLNLPEKGYWSYSVKGAKGSGVIAIYPRI